MVKTKGFVIEKGIPIPVSHGGSPGRQPGKKPPMYPFYDMEVGDSFAAPRDQGIAPPPSYADRRQTNIKSHSVHWAKANDLDWKFTTRLIDGTTVRCWRIA